MEESSDTFQGFVVVDVSNYTSAWPAKLPLDVLNKTVDLLLFAMNKHEMRKLIPGLCTLIDQDAGLI